MAKLLTGKEVVARIAEDLQQRIAKLKQAGIEPALALVRMGERPDDLSYERTACKRADSLGIALRRFVLDGFAPQEALVAALHDINHDSRIHGCLLFRPLPTFIDDVRVCEELSSAKDIDGITQSSLAAVFTDRRTGFPPCTAAACLEMLDFYQIPLEGKHVVVVGRSLVVGKPVSMMLLARHASVTICHSRTENLAHLMQQADIVICAVGRARAFGVNCFRAGQIVLDVGINLDTQGKLCGDVDFEAVEPLVGAISPVPGGLGSVTTSVTMEHTVKAAERELQRLRGRSQR